MSGAQEQGLIGAAESARRAEGNARHAVAADSGPSALRLAEVTAVEETTVSVKILASDGTTAAYTVSGCPVIGNAELAVGDTCLAVYLGDRPLPVILAAGAGGEGDTRRYFQGHDDLGFAGMA